VTVADTGLGIAAEMLPHVFDLFTQAGDSLHRSQGGLGIGLTLVKSLAELHGGRVTAASEGRGRGSTFTVRLPGRPGGGQSRVAETATPGPPPEEGAASAPQAEARLGQQSRVLIVDDNVDMVQGLAQLLRAAGHEVATAHDGDAALAVARSFRPDVVLLDLGLPGRDGYEVARALRQDDRCQGARLIAVSGYGQDQDRRRSSVAGFEHHLVKPVDVETLLGLLAQGESDRSRPPASADRPLDPADGDRVTYP
jgi:CheY-like chemotaxis protein